MIWDWTWNGMEWIIYANEMKMRMNEQVAK